MNPDDPVMLVNATRFPTTASSVCRSSLINHPALWVVDNWIFSLVTQGYVQIDGNDIVSLQRALDESFESHTFAGGYKGALELLLNDKVDVAFGSDIAPEKYLEPEDAAKLRPVAKIGPVPSHVFVASPDLPDSTVKSLTDALVDLNINENNHILQDLYGAEALLPTTTERHMGDFGSFINALTGIDQLILDKYNKAK